MPEGDVLLRVARRLTLALGTGPLVRTELRWPDLGGADLIGQQVSESVSYGKHLFIRTDAGWSLHTHLRMDGTWQVRHTATPPEALRDRSVRAVLATTRWTCVGAYLGLMNLVRTHDERQLISHLGPDLLATQPDLDRAAQNLGAQGSRGVGEVLLDQRVAAGIGTIYLAEALWEHRISPWRPAARVPDATALYATASFLMRRSAQEPELTATGHLGPGLRTHVHDRAGSGCRRCGEPIAVADVGAAPLARPAYYCPVCQT